MAKVQITNAYTFWLLCSVMMNKIRIFYVTCAMNWTEYKTDQCQKKRHLKTLGQETEVNCWPFYGYKHQILTEVTLTCKCLTSSVKVF